MKKLQEDAKERIANRYNQHPIFRTIKKTEMEWFDMSINYRLSAEQVFYEVIHTIDELKKENFHTDCSNLYKRFTIDYRQSAPIQMDQTEINDIVTIIMISAFSPLALSNNLQLQNIAKILAEQCAENNRGYYRKFQNTLCTFDKFANEIKSWIDDYVKKNDIYLSDEIKLVIFPNHFSQYQKRGLNLGKSDDEIHANFANAACNGASALVTYLVTSEGKLYFDFLGHNKRQIIENINRELGSSITYNAFRQAIDRSKDKPKL